MQTAPGIGKSRDDVPVDAGALFISSRICCPHFPFSVILKIVRIDLKTPQLVVVRRSVRIVLRKIIILR